MIQPAVAGHAFSKFGTFAVHNRLNQCAAKAPWQNQAIQPLYSTTQFQLKKRLQTLVRALHGRGLKIWYSQTVGPETMTNFVQSKFYQVFVDCCNFCYLQMKKSMRSHRVSLVRAWCQVCCTKSACMQDSLASCLH
jgi:hypothetical protein